MAAGLAEKLNILPDSNANASTQTEYPFPVRLLTSEEELFFHALSSEPMVRNKVLCKKEQDGKDQFLSSDRELLKKIAKFLGVE
jgi:hypothetical protein